MRRGKGLHGLRFNEDSAIDQKIHIIILREGLEGYGEARFADSFDPHFPHPAFQFGLIEPFIQITAKFVVDSKRQSRHHLINEVKSHLIQNPDWMRNLNGHPK